MVPVRRLSAAVLLGVLLFAGALPTLAARNPDGDAPIRPEAQAVDMSRPDRHIGNGNPASCTSKRVVRAIAQGGVIRFRCGKKPVTIRMNTTARV